MTAQIEPRVPRDGLDRRNHGTRPPRNRYTLRIHSPVVAAALARVAHAEAEMADGAGVEGVGVWEMLRKGNVLETAGQMDETDRWATEISLDFSELG